MVSKLPVRTGVVWDNLGVRGMEPIVGATRMAFARMSSVASSGIAAQLLTTLLSPQAPFTAAQVRSTLGEFTNDPAPEVPVQIELNIVFTPDPRGILVENREALRLGAAGLYLNWLETVEDWRSVLRLAEITRMRVDVMGLGEELIMEFDPFNRALVSGSGGDIQSFQPGYVIPRQF